MAARGAGSTARRSAARRAEHATAPRLPRRRDAQLQAQAAASPPPAGLGEARSLTSQVVGGKGRNMTSTRRSSALCSKTGRAQS